MKYGSFKSISGNFLDIVDRVKSELAEGGFGILFDIDIKDKIREKLGRKFEDYRIIGVCKPSIGYSVLENQIEAGLLLPCHVTVFEKGGNVHVGFLSPKKILSLADNEKIDLVAEEAEKQLQVIFKNI